MTAIQPLIVSPKGIGLRDYSQGTEFAVEPTIRSYQSVYSSWQTVTVNAGADRVVDVAIPGGHVAIVYDFYATVPDFVLLGMLVQAIHGLVIGDIINKTSYGSIDEHLAKGFPFFETLRFTIHNFDSVARDVNIGAVGIYTDEEHYYLSVTPP